MQFAIRQSQRHHNVTTGHRDSLGWPRPASGAAWTRSDRRVRPRDETVRSCPQRNLAGTSAKLLPSKSFHLLRSKD